MQGSRQREGVTIKLIRMEMVSTMMSINVRIHNQAGKSTVWVAQSGIDTDEDGVLNAQDIVQVELGEDIDGDGCADSERHG